MDKTLHYLFDPLCGWCYGATQALNLLRGTADVELRLLPSGLFAGQGARPMDADFAAYAWSNDQRIEQLTGQRFTEQYRTEVLDRQPQMFDSGPATLALTAVMLSAPARELDALKAIQRARYVDGQDITHAPTLAAVLLALELDQAAARVIQADEELLAVNRARMAQAQALLNQSRARGVPTFILETNGHRQLLPSSAAYSNPQAFVEQISAA